MAEEVFRSHLRVRRIERGDIAGEDVYSALGRTADGRHLVIFFILWLREKLHDQAA